MSDKPSRIPLRTTTATTTTTNHPTTVREHPPTTTPPTPPPLPPRAHHLACKTIAQWKSFVSTRKASRFHQSHLLQSSLAQWKYVHMYRWRMRVKADVHRRLGVFDSRWDQWRDKLRRRRVEKGKVEKAVAFANATVLQKCVQHWIMYRDHRRIRSLRNRFAASSHDTMQLHKVFQFWKSKLRRKQELRSLELAAEEADRGRVRRGAWKRWVGLFGRNVVWGGKVERFEALRRRELLDRAISGWKDYTRLRKLKEEKRVALDSKKRRENLKLAEAHRVQQLK
ncbi:hypothetical protein HDU98_001721, partial [Podochytrium sp. JEL0797]